MHHFVAGERGAERHRHLGAAAADHRRMARYAADAGRLHVLGGEHGQHLFGRARRLGVDRQHAGMGVRRAHEGGIGLVRQPRVVRETAIAAHQGVVLDARFVFAAGEGCRGHGGSDNRACGAPFIAEYRAGQGLASAARLRHSGAPHRRLQTVFRGRNEQSAHHRYPHPHPDPGNRRPADARPAPKVPVTITPDDAESPHSDVGGVLYRPFPTGGFDIARRLRDMDAAGVDVHVLSATPQTYLYNQDAALTAVTAAIQNDQMAKHIAAHPTRFMGIATLPMQAPEARGRRTQARHDQARPARRDVRLACLRKEPGRSELRAAVGDRRGTRRLHVHPSGQCRRRRPAEVLLSRQPDRQSARHHHCRGLSLFSAA